jgi:hypothetical protein
VLADEFAELNNCDSPRIFRPDEKLPVSAINGSCSAVVTFVTSYFMAWWLRPANTELLQEARLAQGNVSPSWENYAWPSRPLLPIRVTRFTHAFTINGGKSTIHHIITSSSLHRLNKGHIIEHFIRSRDTMAATDAGGNPGRKRASP